MANGAVSYGAPRPKPPLNAYANFHRYFCGTPGYKDALKAMGPTKAVGAPMKLTSAAWADLSAAEKNIWQADAKAAKAAYNLEHYGEQPKEKRARKSSSDSDSGGGAPKTAKLDKKFTAPGDDTGVKLIVIGTWPALELADGSVYTISKQFCDKDLAEKAYALKKAARKPHARKPTAPRDAADDAADKDDISAADDKDDTSAADEDEAEEAEPEAEPEPEPARKTKRARKTSRL
jgi:hypothetical protein